MEASLTWNCISIVECKWKIIKDVLGVTGLPVLLIRHYHSKLKRGINMVGKTPVNNNPVTNTNAVVSFTLGILSVFIPAIGLVLGIIGIVFYQKAKNEIAVTGEGGRGLATAGLVCSIVGIFLQIFIIMAYFFFFFLVVQ